MPIYEYVCDDCGEHYERIVLNQSSAVECPKCASGKRTIQISVFAAHSNGGSSKAFAGSSAGPTGPKPSGGGGGCCGGGCGCR